MHSIEIYRNYSLQTYLAKGREKEGEKKLFHSENKFRASDSKLTVCNSPFEERNIFFLINIFSRQTKTIAIIYNTNFIILTILIDLLTLFYIVVVVVILSTAVLQQFRFSIRFSFVLHI